MGKSWDSEEYFKDIYWILHGNSWETHELFGLK